MNILRNRIRLIVVLVLGLTPQVAFACKGDADHNRKFHGDPQCRNCNCVHHRPEPKDPIFISFEDGTTLQIKPTDPKNKQLEELSQSTTVGKK